MKKRVLIVDDAAFMRLVLRNMLVKNGYEVVGEASNGQEAIEKYKTVMPDIVTMDITMPVMEGIEALKHIRQHDAEAKVIMCSAMGQQIMVVQSLQAGARDFIVKPFQEERVLESIQRVAGI